MPSFLTKKQVYEWIRTGEKTIELRRGKTINGENITFRNGKGQKLRALVLRTHEGKLEEVLNVTTYKQIVPSAKNLDEAFAFIRKIYPLTEGTFTTYEFQLNEEA